MLTRVQLMEEILEIEKDLQAFKVAHDAINGRAQDRRLRALAQGRDGESFPFAEWDGTVGSLCVLNMCIVRCEGLLEDCRQNLDQLPHGMRLAQLEEDDGG